MIRLGPGERLFTIAVRSTDGEWDEYDLAAWGLSDALRRAREMAADATSDLVAWYGPNPVVGGVVGEPAAFLR